MEKKSIVITTGAMATALFGVMMWLNRQSGNLFQEIFIFLYPIPMVAYAALYGLRNGAAVCASMSLLAFLLGDFTTIFYALTQAVIGLVFGSCLHHKVDMTKTLLTVMLLSAFVNLLNTVFLGFLFGIDINREVAEIQGMMKAMFEQTGQAAPENIMSLDSLKQIFIVSMILSGFLQGFIVYEVSLLLLRRLRFHVQKPKSVFLYTPPVWTGYVALLAFMVTNRSLIIPYDNIHLQNVILAVGVLCYMYLICFGFIAILRMLKTAFKNGGKWGWIVCILLTFLLPMAEAMMGFIYIVNRQILGFKDQE